MFDANAYLASGVESAVTQTSAHLRARPRDAAARTFLWELLSLSGDLNRAARQISASAGLTADQDAGIVEYVHLLGCEQVRRTIFESDEMPHLPCGISPLLNHHRRAISFVRLNEIKTAQAELELASSFWHLPAGVADGRRFTDLRDSDDLMAPFLEAVIDGKYSWVEWRDVKTLQIVQLKYLRDLLWLPAFLDLQNGWSGKVYLSCLYPFSHLEEDAIKLGQQTKWLEESELSIGRGQRVLSTNELDVPLSEIRHLSIDMSPAETQVPKLAAEVENDRLA